jgi:hypothetical protein
LKKKLKLLGGNILKKKAEHVRLTRAIYVELFASCAPTTKEIRVFEQKQINKELKRN